MTQKLIPALFITGVLASVFVACGPSAEEKAAAEQRMKDSIAAVEQAKADSMLAVQQQAMEDSLAMVKAMQDSIAKAVEDSLANVKSGKPKPKPKPAPAPTKPEEVKPGQGRG